MTKAVLIMTGGLLLIAFFLYFSFDDKIEEISYSEIQILDSWELPEKLDEISGIAYIENRLIACIQDEDGIIFIYDLGKREIVREIEFAEPGDYESITLGDNTAYVLRSDGAIYEVANFMSDTPVTQILYTPEKSGKNFEGLEFDANNNRLLISIKENSGKKDRPVYSFDLELGKMLDEPVFRISFSDPIFSVMGKRASEKFLRPSEITIHPQTGKIYMLEGIDPKILVLNEDGTPEEIHLLNRKQFPQAEGLSFGEKGEIYISNERKGDKPNILHISLN